MRPLIPLFVPCLLSMSAIAQSDDERPASRPSSRPAAAADAWTGVLDEKEFAALHELSQAEVPELHGADIRLRVPTEGGDEAREETAYLSLPEGRPRGGVVVIHEWWGLNRHVRNWTDRLAADGYAALAVDLYGGVVATDRDGASAAVRGVVAEDALATLRAAHRFLVEDERIEAERTGVVGWCFGGGWSLQLAIAEPELDAAVVYYGRLVDDVETLGRIRAPVLGVFGTEDRGIPVEGVLGFADAMKRAGREFELRMYDAEHAFANPSSARYDAEHAAEAWVEVRTFFREHLADASTSFVDGGELRFDLPDGWQDTGRASSMRVATVEVPGDLECAVFAFANRGGGLLANVNRWRGQFGLDAMSADEAEALPELRMLGRAAKRVRIAGDFSGGMSGGAIEDAVMLATVCPLEDRAVFVRLVGPRQAVDAQAKAFDAFCGSLR